jgi:hypothetical protein
MPAKELNTLEDLRRHFRNLNSRRPEDDISFQWWQVAKRITWMLLLAESFLIYYLLDKLLEALALL